MERPRGEASLVWASGSCLMEGLVHNPLRCYSHGTSWNPLSELLSPSVAVTLPTDCRPFPCACICSWEMTVLPSVPTGYCMSSAAEDGDQVGWLTDFTGLLSCSSRLPWINSYGCRNKPLKLGSLKWDMHFLRAPPEIHPDQGNSYGCSYPHPLAYRWLPFCVTLCVPGLIPPSFSVLGWNKEPLAY